MYLKYITIFDYCFLEKTHSALSSQSLIFSWLFAYPLLNIPTDLIKLRSEYSINRNL